MAIDLKINDTTYTIPTEWKEVTVGQYVALCDNATDLTAARMLSIFTGIEHETLLNLPIEHFNIQVLPELTFIATEWNPFSQPRQKKIKIGKYEFDTIFDPSRERLGQKLFLQQLVNKAILESVPHYNLICPVVACYYAPYVHPEKKWEEKHVMEFAKLVEKATIAEMYPEANFFLTGYMRYLPKKATL